MSSQFGPTVRTLDSSEQRNTEGVGGRDGICSWSGREAGAGAVDGAASGVRRVDHQEAARG